MSIFQSAKPKVLGTPLWSYQQCWRLFLLVSGWCWYSVVCAQPTAAWLVEATQQLREPSCTTLKIANRGLSTPAEIQQLFGILPKNHRLQTLNLEQNKLDAPALAVLLAELSHHPQLKNLQLLSNFGGVAGARILGDFLATNRSLRTLDFGFNRIRDAGSVALARGLANNHTLKELDLSGNKIGDVGIVALAQALEKNPGLISLDLGFNHRIAAVGGQAMAKALRKNRILHHLSMWGTSIPDQELAILIQALAQNTTLTTLSLDVSNFGLAAARALAETLARNRTLTFLSLGFNKIDGHTMEIIVGGLLKNRGLQELALRGNALGASREGIAALVKLLSSPRSTIRALVLSSNGLDDAAVTSMLQSIAPSSALKELNLCDNPIGALGKKAMEAFLLSHPRFKIELKLL